MSTELISLREAAAQLDVHYMTAYRYVRTGRLPARQEGSRWLVDPADVDRLRTRPPSAGRRGRPDVGGGAEALAARLIASDEAGSWAVVEATLASGASPAQVHLDLLAPALRIIGDKWAAGEITVADEHRASSVAQRLIGRLGPQFARPGRKRGAVVVSTPPGERHGLPSAIVSDLLRGAGYDVIDTGPDTPAESLAETAGTVDRLVAVVIGATTPDTDRAVRRAVRAVRRATPDTPVLVGGAAVADEAHAQTLGADGWSGADGAAVVATVDHLVASSDAG